MLWHLYIIQPCYIHTNVCWASPLLYLALNVCESNEGLKTVYYLGILIGQVCAKSSTGLVKVTTSCCAGVCLVSGL